MRQFSFLIASCIIAIGLLAGCQRNDTFSDLPETVDFNFHIRPILSNTCYVCHGPDGSSREAELRLDQKEYATAKREDGRRAIVPGRASRSLLIERISSEDPDLRMPPKEENKILAPREVALLRKWINQGAEYKEHWALIPPVAPETQGVDPLILEKIEGAGLNVAPAASKASQLRRVSYVLTGLPPSPESLRAFLQDESSDAYERVVDSLLASPHFGERWARHWMDLVRYAESRGHEFDFTVQGAWQYRDYLTRAFNADVPYNQFLTEHLAGDLLENPRLHPEEGYEESPIATTFFAMGEGKHSPVDVRVDQAERFDNIIDVTTKTFHGLTVACARCHDHKFDPIPTTDYYSLYGIVESSRFSNTPIITSRYRSQLDSLIGASRSLRRSVAEQWMASLEEDDLISTISIAGTTQIHNVAAEDSTFVLGDFSDGTSGDWYTDGPAFSDGTAMDVPLFSGNAIEGLLTGVVTSRRYGIGIPGGIRSPTFTIEHDSLVVYAGGLDASVRVIVDGQQLIRSPIFGHLDRQLYTGSIEPHVFDITMWKGRKAYVEVLTGRFNQGRYLTEHHVLQQDSTAYFDLAYAAAYNHTRPALEPTVSETSVSLTEAIGLWKENRSTPDHARTINDALGSGRLSKRLQGIEAPGSPPMAIPEFFMGLTDGDTVTSGVFNRGNANMEEADPVPHRFFTALDPSQTSFTLSASGRLDMARAMTAPDNPLTARVMVNRLWHHVFGRGIVETVDNFGAQGSLPSHPELLDYLAVRFEEQGWSVKKILREMVLSEAFLRESKAPNGVDDVDPNNLLLTYYPVRRLEAEAIRDGILAVSGTVGFNHVWSAGTNPYFFVHEGERATQCFGTT